jgi:hypothetical protein
LVIAAVAIKEGRESWRGDGSATLAKAVAPAGGGRFAVILESRFS